MGEYKRNKTHVGSETSLERRLEFRRVVVLSTAHVDGMTAEAPPVTVMFNCEFGWVMYCYSKEASKYRQLPRCLKECCRYVRKQLKRQGKERDGVYIMFDRDGPVMAGLPAYDW